MNKICPHYPLFEGVVFVLQEIFCMGFCFVYIFKSFYDITPVKVMG